MGWRFRMFVFRSLEFILRWPGSVWRLILWVLWIRSPRGKHSIIRWLCGGILLIADLTPWHLVYETIMDTLKWKTRPLLVSEIEIIQSVFGTSIATNLISMDHRSIPAIKGWTIAYTSFHTINYADQLPHYTLVHEAVHLWQYRFFGSSYLSEAIWAQRWGGGYNYGGLDQLMHNDQKEGLLSFNFEQQADIIEDYFRMKAGLPLQWISSQPESVVLLERYALQLQVGKREMKNTQA